MNALDLRHSSRVVQLALLLVLVVLAWHLSAPTAYEDNIDDIVDTSDPHGYVPFFVFLVATGLFVHDWPRAEFAAGVVIAGVATIREVVYEWNAMRGDTAEDLTHLAQQPGMLYLFGICAGLAMAVSGAMGLRGRGRSRRRSILFMGETGAFRQRALTTEQASGRALAPPPEGELLASDHATAGSPTHGPVEFAGLSACMRALTDPEPAMRLKAASWLAGCGADGHAAIPTLVGCLRDSDPAVRDAALRALEQVVGATSFEQGRPA